MTANKTTERNKQWPAAWIQIHCMSEVDCQYSLWLGNKWNEVFPVNLNGHVWEQLMCMVAFGLWWKTKSLCHFCDILISQWRYNKAKSHLENTVRAPLPHAKLSFSFWFPVKCENPNKVKSKEEGLLIGGLYTYTQGIHYKVCKEREKRKSKINQWAGTHTCYIKNFMTRIQWCIKRQREEKDRHRMHECRSPSQLNGHAVAPGSGWVCVRVGIRFFCLCRRVTTLMRERKLKSGASFVRLLCSPYFNLWLTCNKYITPPP